MAVGISSPVVWCVAHWQRVDGSHTKFSIREDGTYREAVLWRGGAVEGRCYGGAVMWT